MSRIRLYPMTSALRALISDLIDDRGIKGYRALSHRTGGEVSYETVRRILTGQVSQVRFGTLKALAEALQTPIGEFIESSVGDARGIPWQLSQEFDPMPLTMRPGIERALLALFRESRILPPSGSPDHD